MKPSLGALMRTALYRYGMMRLTEEVKEALVIIGDNIRKHRKEKGLPHAKLAEAVGLSEAAIRLCGLCDIENVREG